MIRVELRRSSMIVLVLLLLVPAINILAGAQAGPTVTITYPRNDEIVAGTMDIEGESTRASRVEVKLDADDSWSLATGSGTWNYSLDTTTMSDDSHIIFARAMNGTDVSTVETIRFYVNNTPPEFIRMDITATPTDLGPAENITVSGFLEYDTGVKLIGAIVTMNILGTGIEDTVVTDDAGYFLRKVTSPSDAGKYTLSVTTSDGTLEEAREFSLTVTTPYQPDLRVSKIELNPPNPNSDDTVEVFATIDNIGNQEGSAKIKFYIDDDLLDSKAVTIDKSKIVKTVWIARSGTHDVKVKITDVSPADRDTSNNERTMVVTPRSVPEVAITDLASSNPTPREGIQVSVLVRIENEGYAGTTGTVELFDGDPIQNNLIGKKSFTIDSNETLSMYIVWTPLKGEHTLNAKLSVVGEDTNERHTKSTLVSVLPPIKKPVETSGLGAILTLIALLVVALMIGSGRKDL